MVRKAVQQGRNEKQHNYERKMHSNAFWRNNCRLACDKYIWNAVIISHLFYVWAILRIFFSIFILKLSESRLFNSHQLSCNSCSRLTRTWELRKLSYKLSLVNSHQLSCNSCSRLTRTWELRKFSYKLSLVNFQLRLTGLKIFTIYSSVSHLH